MITIIIYAKEQHNNTLEFFKMVKWDRFSQSASGDSNSQCLCMCVCLSVCLTISRLLIGPAMTLSSHWSESA